MSSNEDLYYLKLNVALEALVDRWYAWSHLLSPVTAGMNIKDRHLKIMESYMRNPQIHAAAIKKPEMLGGPFIDYEGGRVAEIKELYDDTVVKRSKVLDLRKDVRELNSMLLKNAKGYSLNALYEKIPEGLKGFVELYYDLNNRPSFRFFEYLLYKSEYYDESAQTISLQLIQADNDRSFVLSTPRLNDEDLIHLDIPFKETVIDDLFAMKRTPQSLENIEKALAIDPSQSELFRSFFTKEPPAKYVEYTGKGIRTKYFGHACVLIETDEVSILVDPVISYDGYETDVNRYTINDLPEQIDYIMITHNHQDHVLLETLLQLRHCTKNVIVPSCSKGDLQDPSLKLMFKEIGFDSVIELDEMETIELERCTITGLPFLGEHSDLDVRSKLCYHVELHNEFKVMMVADSCVIEPTI